MVLVVTARRIIGQNEVVIQELGRRLPQLRVFLQHPFDKIFQRRAHARNFIQVGGVFLHHLLVQDDGLVSRRIWVFACDHLINDYSEAPNVAWETILAAIKSFRAHVAQGAHISSG